MRRAHVGLPLLMALTACAPGPRATPGKVLRRVVVRNGREMTEQRISRDTALPFKYDAWVTQFKLGLDTRLASTNVAAGREVKVLREVGERIQLLVNLRTELAKDWNAFAISEANYQRRAEHIDNSILALQTLVGAQGDPDLSEAVLDQIAEWARRPAPPPAETHRPLRLRVWTVGQRPGRRGGIEEVLIREGATMYSGDRFRVGVQPSKDCYVYLVVRDAQQRVNVFFPSAQAVNNRVEADRELYMPGEGLSFELGKETGTETIYVLASEQNLTDVDELVRVLQDVQTRDVFVVHSGSGGAVQKAARLDDGREVRRVTELVEGYGAVMRSFTIDHR